MASSETRTSAFPNSGSRIAHPKIDAIRNDPQLGALVDKLVSAGPTPGTTLLAQHRGIQMPNDTLLRRVSDITATNVNDAAAQMQLLPDTELSMQLLTSVILSPKDMMTIELIYGSNMDIQNAELSQALLNVLRNYFDNVYKIKPLLTTMLEDALFKVGAYPLVVLPENVLDAAINSTDNVTMESLMEQFDSRTSQLHNLGILGCGSNDRAPVSTKGITLESLRGVAAALTYDPKVTVSVESFNKLLNFEPNERLKEETIKSIKERFTLESTFLTVTDNPNVLKLPLVEDAFRTQRIQKAYRSQQVSIEARRTKKEKSAISIQELQSGLYRHRRYKNVPVLPLMPMTDDARPTIGHPLVMKLPSESIIPVHVPSNPEQHLGYFVLLDLNGNALTRTNHTDYFNDLSTSLNSNQEMVSQLMATTRQAELGRDMVRDMDEDELIRVYGELVERDLMARLRNGVYGENVEISRPSETMRVMFSRACAKMHTQLLYIPAEYMVYIAFDYNKYGVGMSLLQKNKIVGGLRAMMLFANTMASIKNSVQRMVINITLDPNDPQPTNTVEFLLHEVAKTRQSSYPLGASNPIDLISFLQKAGTEVVVQGNTRYPETKVELESKQSSYAKPDTELEDSLRKRFLMGLGLSPEMVDSSSQADFATTIVQQNLMLAKRGLNYQGTLMGFIEEFIRKYTINSSFLMDELCEVMEANVDKIPNDYKNQTTEDGKPVPAKDDDSTPALRYLSMFMRTLKVSLPAPDVSQQKNQKEAFESYRDFLDEALDGYIDPESMDESTAGEYASSMTTLRKTIRSYYLRQWLRVNGVLPELDDMVTVDADGKPKVDLLGIQEGHMEGLMLSFGAYLDKMIEYRKTHPMPTDTPEEPDGGEGADAGNGGLDGGDTTGVTGDGSETPDDTTGNPDDTSTTDFDDTAGVGDETGDGTDTTSTDETSPDETAPPEEGDKDATETTDETVTDTDDTSPATDDEAKSAEEAVPGKDDKVDDDTEAKPDDTEAKDEDVGKTDEEEELDEDGNPKKKKDKDDTSDSDEDATA